MHPDDTLQRTASPARPLPSCQCPHPRSLVDYDDGSSTSGCPPSPRLRKTRHFVNSRKLLAHEHSKSDSATSTILVQRGSPPKVKVGIPASDLNGGANDISASLSPQVRSYKLVAITNILQTVRSMVELDYVGNVYTTESIEGLRSRTWRRTAQIAHRTPEPTEQRRAVVIWASGSEDIMSVVVKTKQTTGDLAPRHDPRVWSTTGRPIPSRTRWLHPDRTKPR